VCHKAATHVARYLLGKVFLRGLSKSAKFLSPLIFFTIFANSIFSQNILSVAAIFKKKCPTLENGTLIFLQFAFGLKTKKFLDLSQSYHSASSVQAGLIEKLYN
jgi:hypothetical protein